MKKLFVFLLLISCSKDQKHLTTLQGEAFGMQYKILVGEKISDEQYQRIHHIVFDTFQKIQDVFNNFNPDSEISHINRSNTPQTLSNELSTFLHELKKIIPITENRFDPTVGPLVTLWKDHLEKGTTPPSEKIDSLKPSIGWDKLELSKNQFTKVHPNVELNLCGASKGYGVDLLVQELRLASFNNFYVEWGGEIRTAGRHPQGRPWNVFVSRLGSDSPNDGIAWISLHDEAIATSGNYYQMWQVDGKSYTHIIDPHSGHALQVTEKSPSSVSVIAPSCFMADTLATATMLFSTVEEAKKWAEEVENRDPNIRFFIY